MTLNITHIKDLVHDSENRRCHNPRNVGVIADSLSSCGAGRSIVVDENNTIIAGNATVDAAAEVGITKVRLVEADGHELIAVRRVGLTEDQKRKLAIFDNRASELASWDLAQLESDLQAGLDFDGAFYASELKKITKAVEQLDDEASGSEVGNAAAESQVMDSLVFRFASSDYRVVVEALDGLCGAGEAREQVLLRLLGVKE